MARLKKSRRPLTLSFLPGSALTSDGDLKSENESLKISKSDSKHTRRQKLLNIRMKKQNSLNSINEQIGYVTKITFKEKTLLMMIKPTPNNKAAIVTGFKLDAKGNKGAAEKCGKIKIGMILTKIQDQSTKNLSFKETFNLFANASRPINLEFMNSSDIKVILKKPPTDIKISIYLPNEIVNNDNDNEKIIENKSTPMIVINGFDSIPGPGEQQLKDKIQSGYTVKTINNENVYDLKFKDVIKKLSTAPRPLEILFTTPPPLKIQDNEVLLDESADDINKNNQQQQDQQQQQQQDCKVIFNEPGSLGLIFYKREDKQCCFKAFAKMPSPSEKSGKIYAGNVLLGINDIDFTSNEFFDNLEIDKTNVNVQEYELFIKNKINDLFKNTQLPCKLKIRNMEQYEALKMDL